MKVSPNKALAELCRRDLFTFVKVFWDVVITEEPVYNWHIPYLCSELEKVNKLVVERKPKEYDLLINISPGTTKTTIASVMYPVWAWVTDPKQRFITSSYSSTISILNSTKSRDIIRSNKFKLLFPDIEIKKDNDNKSHYINTSGGERFATSTGGAVTGQHAHQIIIDDPLNTKEATSKAERESAEHHVFQTLSSRKVDKKMTPTIMIMQRLHESDPSGIMLKKENVRHICLPAEESENIKPVELRKYYSTDGLFDPIRLDNEVLNEAKKDLGSYGFANQYSQETTPAEGGILKTHWFPIKQWDNDFNNFDWNTVIDPAYTSDKKNDESGFMQYAIEDGKCYIRHAESVFKEFPDLVRYTNTYPMKHGYDSSSRVYVEPKASGKSLVQQCLEDTELNIIEDDAPIKDKEARANDISPKCEAGRVILIEGPWNSELLNQIKTFPKSDQDGLIDCLIMAVNKLDEGETSGISRRRRR